MGICFSCFSPFRKKNQQKGPYLKPFDSSKVVNAKDEDLLATFPDSLSESSEDENIQNIQNNNNNKPQNDLNAAKDGNNELEKVVDTPHLL